jgi:hypothetical protein
MHVCEVQLTLRAFAELMVIHTHNGERIHGEGWRILFLRDCITCMS